MSTPARDHEAEAADLIEWLTKDPEIANKTIRAGLGLAFSHGYDPDAEPWGLNWTVDGGRTWNAQ